jgi:hypothetical protein
LMSEGSNFSWTTPEGLGELGVAGKSDIALKVGWAREL